jgi:hypothetical protein
MGLRGFFILKWGRGIATMLAGWAERVMTNHFDISIKTSFLRITTGKYFFCAFLQAQF